MSNRVTEEEKEKINELYLEIGTYAGVARRIGRAPSTVKRYIIPNYKPKTDEFTPFKGKIMCLGEIDIPVGPEQWDKWLNLDKKEQKACEELRREI